MQTPQATFALQQELLSEGQLNELVEKLIALREHKKALEEEIKEINAAMENLEAILITKMKEAGLQNFKTDAGLQVIIRKDLYVTVNKEKEMELFSWLYATGRGEVIKPTVHPQTLRAIVKEAKESGLPLPPCISTHEKERISLRKTKK